MTHPKPTTTASIARDKEPSLRTHLQYGEGNRRCEQIFKAERGTVASHTSLMRGEEPSLRSSQIHRHSPPSAIVAQRGDKRSCRCRRPAPPLARRASTRCADGQRGVAARVRPDQSINRSGRWRAGMSTSPRTPGLGPVRAAGRTAVERGPSRPWRQCRRRHRDSRCTAPQSARCRRSGRQGSSSPTRHPMAAGPTGVGSPCRAVVSSCRACRHRLPVRPPRGSCTRSGSGRSSARFGWSGR